MRAKKPEDDRIGVRKTYKLYIGGAFPRSESGEAIPLRITTETSRRTPPSRHARTRAMQSLRHAPHSEGGRGRPLTTAGKCCIASLKSWKVAATSS